MRALSVTVNGRGVQARVEPRLSLVDFLREHQFLTATHVGCEHGVCGACTVLVDGAPARSCITFAVAADRAEVTTLEGLESDAVMNALREAFAEHHALQCGFCTPGMLMTARDIVTRLPDADEKRIRLELSGNLCRCTGYVGIVQAIQSVLGRTKSVNRTAVETRRGVGPVGSHPPLVSPDMPQSVRAARPGRQPASPKPENLDGIDWSLVERDGVVLRETFSVPFGRSEVWRFFSDLDQVTRCMPGARLVKPIQGDRTEGEINIKLGPIVSAFHGVLAVNRDDANFRGVVRGAGRDSKSPSSARAIIVYEVGSMDTASSRIDVSVTFLLSGALAQFSRSGLVKDVADHLTRVFARNLEARLSGGPTSNSADMLDAGAVARSAIWLRISRIFRRMFRN